MNNFTGSKIKVSRFNTAEILQTNLPCLCKCVGMNSIGEIGEIPEILQALHPRRKSGIAEVHRRSGRLQGTKL